MTGKGHVPLADLAPEDFDLNRTGQSLLRLPAAQPAGLPEVALPLASLAQAEYVVQISASFGADSVARMVSFVLVP